MPGIPRTPPQLPAAPGIIVAPRSGSKQPYQKCQLLWGFQHLTHCQQWDHCSSEGWVMRDKLSLHLGWYGKTKNIPRIC